MTPRHLPLPRNGVVPRSLPLGSIWSKITSDIGGILTNGAAPTTSPTAGNVSPAAASTVMTTEFLTTVWRTSLVTVHLTPTAAETQTPNQPHHTSPVTSDDGSTTIPSSAPASTVTGNQHSLSLPTGLGTSSGISTLSSTLANKGPSASATAAAGATASKSNTQQKHAIIGGLSGAIAGLILIGVLIVFFLRRRRKLNDEDRQSTSEKGVGSAVAKKWSQLVASRDIPPRPFLPDSRGTTTPDIDGGLIRLSLDRWPRPYAHGESYRESIGPQRLQVMNPSPSRPSTPLPRGSSESATNFFNRQRSALAAVITGVGRPSGDSIGESSQRNVPIPTIAVDPALSRECVVLNAPTPSFRSYSSVSSTPMVEQRPPEDPFLTPPDERAEDAHNATFSRRPGIAPLQSAAGAASRTFSHIGSALNPFRSKSHVAESVISSSRRSVSTFSSGGDPFQLDRPSPHEERRAAGEIEPAQMSNWNLYEGT